MNFFFRRFATDIPLMSMDHFAWMLSFNATADDLKLAEHPYYKAAREQLKPKLEKKDDVAIVPIEGTLAHRPSVGEMCWDGVEDSRNVLGMLQDCADDDKVKGVLIRMDTPGGMYLGGPEISDKVAAIEKKKPVVTHIGGMGASLGYLIAAPSTEIIANKSGIVGSIGVIASLPDYSALLSRIGVNFDVFTNKDAKFKGAGAMGSRLNQEQREHIQQNIEGAFQVFKSTVLEHRPQVKAEAMQGQTFRGADAKGMGLVDRIGDEAYAMSVLKSLIR